MKPFTLVVLIYLGLGFIIYGNVVGGDFLFDDFGNVVDNVYVKDFSHLKEIFTQDSLAGAGFKLGWYRPVLLLSYAVDYHLWGLNPVGYHVVNIFLHIFSATALFFITLKLFKKIKIAFLSGFIFLIHPVQTEVVSYISGRADILLVFFLLISFLALLYSLKVTGSRKKIILIFISLASFIMALLSKETAIIFPFLIVLFRTTLNKGNSIKNNLRTTAPFFAIAGAYQLLRIYILDLTNAYNSFGQDLIQRSWMFLRVLPIYWGKLILPVDLHYHYERKLLINHLDPQVIVSILILAAIIILVKICKTQRNLIIFGFGWFFIAMIPTSGILVPINFIIGERWLYFSTIGIILIIAVLVHKFFNYPPKSNYFGRFVALLLIGYFLFFIFLGIRRNLIWRDGVVLLKNTLAYAPYDPKLHNILATEYVRHNQYNEAVNEFEIALSIDLNDPNIYHNLAVLYSYRDLEEEIMTKFDKLISSNYLSHNVFISLADKYAGAKDYNKSVRLLKKVVQIWPDSWQAYYRLGVYSFLSGNRKEAISALEKALYLNPGSNEIKMNLEIIR